MNSWEEEINEIQLKNLNERSNALWDRLKETGSKLDRKVELKDKLLFVAI